ncbi:hypothetical protein N9Z02_00920 [Akkermansiaceae bacterium]|nr:hypothetical protein [Akkermansiaceae bacterium]
MKIVSLLLLLIPSSHGEQLSIEKLGSTSVNLTLSEASSSGFMLTTSNDLNFDSSEREIYIPPGAPTPLIFPLDSSSPQFFRTEPTTPDFSLSSETFSASEQTLIANRRAESGQYYTSHVYRFDADGTGRVNGSVAVFLSGGSEESNFVWTESVLAGETLIELTFPDGAKRFIRVLLPEDETLLDPVNFSFGSVTQFGGKDSFLSSNIDAFGISDDPPGLGSDVVSPASLVGTTWNMTTNSNFEEPFEIQFLTASSAVGPGIENGSPDQTLSYVYFQTGPNTGTIDFSDSEGREVRVTLWFNGEGTFALGQATRAMNPSPFGDPTGTANISLQ